MKEGFLIYRIFFLLSIFFLITGVIFFLFEKINFKNPLDFKIERENFKFYFPLGTSIIVSIVLTIILNIIFRFFKR
ncbi:MAG: Uncharacterized protein XD76_1620 [candidate division TA06 bacterium 32_111]|uniref:DUF2905 domain-containing protein n=2 Tax=Bacteria candidate phyla TaxID=1783234 RepID=A0A101I158_UNCT6|nr:MAG: Uncharacterized protein XD76_1620 [candidate division TA06 bacterium 32_111]KUK86323.1 MAG: Uncharacterized protein XE03_1578 [candidate division TA06 bacterium 34_109]HAF08426.1 DUF2905 domain-containing protein [candidate division WOR-3 bacterium]HCP17210.1 DUF2905 domain-containing protein [candidate division WOR-3 bacterium]